MASLKAPLLTNELLLTSLFPFPKPLSFKRLILESLVDGGLPNTKEGTDLIHTETLLKEKGWDPCLQIMRKHVWRHDDKIINPYIYYLTARIEPEESHALVRKKVAFPHTYERCCKSDLSVARSYETDIILERRGEHSVPRKYLKEAHWDAHNNPNRMIDLGYYAQDPHRNYHAVDFDFNTLMWGTIHKKSNGKYRLTIPTPIELGLCIVDEERGPQSDWGEIDGSKDHDDTPEE